MGTQPIDVLDIYSKLLCAGQWTFQRHTQALLMTPVSPERMFQLPPHLMADLSCERLASVPGMPSHSAPPIEDPQILPLSRRFSPL
ncbi:hypothetical protein L208DRAFT_1404989 [Tricholoma matsutake]|nr:hypothetical protein L208DRAFT_1404989 [Tricholoma matsutake 945]